LKVEKIIVGKKVLVGVTGSIAIYKSLELIRYLTKAGAEVKVVMTESAKKFINPLTFETLTGNKVLDDQSEDWSSDMNHIAIGKWADSFVIAPVTANTINKLANGFADNILLQTVLAYGKNIILSPSANTNMIFNPITEGSLKLLNLANFTILGTQTKELACKTDGDGAMSEPETIFFAVAKQLLKTDFWEHRKVIVTGGGTIEKIDEVRFISNFSSGKMASSLAMALYFKGADVCFISSKFPNPLPEDMCKIDVESADEMNLYLIDSIRHAQKGVLIKPKLGESGEIRTVQKKPYLFMASAVSDYKPKFSQSGKLKSDLIGKSWNIDLVENIDILESISKENLVSIGFKAEMDLINGEKFARKMIQQKNLDAVCLNILSDSKSFGTDTNQIDLIYRGGEIQKFQKLDKMLLSIKIIEKVQNLDN